MSDFRDYESFHSEIAEWFDRDGNYHEGHPTKDELIGDAVEIVIHAWDDNGNEMYWTSFSHIGWTEQMYHADVEDGYNHYVGIKR